MQELLIETQTFKPSVLLKEGKISTSGNPVVTGILATAEVKNGNGRYYARSIWEREIGKYDELIKERRSMGELDHPECFIEGYKIMTQEKGWVEFKNLSGDEHVATLNINSRELEYQSIVKITNQLYKGDIINIESKTFQANVTPNHRFIVENHDKTQLKLVEAQNMAKTSLIPKKSTYGGGYNNDVIIENEKGKISIPSNIFSKFMGWWLAEGWLQYHKTTRGKISKGIYLSQSKNNNIESIDKIFESLSNILGKKYSKHYRKNNEIEYYILDHVLYDYLTQFKLCDQKFIPKEIKQLNKENIQLFLDAYLLADGTKQKNQEVYYTTSEQMALDISELINLTGYMSSTSTKQLAFEKYLVEGKWIKDFDWYTKPDRYKNCIIEDRKKHYTGKTLYSIRRKYSDYYHINDCDITTSHYDGNIYCVSVPNETILVMSPNGSSFWSGNSQTINLNNVSHLITRWWWDGDHIMGDIEILPTPSGNILKTLIENNVLVGVSSRGMGSVEQKGELLEVADDFTLISFDFVSTPSNPGSWMKPKSLNESKNYNKNIYNNINNIIREILCSKGSCPLN